MELRVLEYFLALGRAGSISGAAEALHISQPTLSRQLMDLERELGCTLFTRSKRGITLTEDGLLLRRRAAEIVDLAGIARTELAASRSTIEGEVRIGCAETLAFDIVARAMRDFQRDHTRVTFAVSSGLAEDVAEKVKHGLLDFGLLLRVRDSWNLASLALPTSEKAVVIVPEGHRLAAFDTVTMDDLASIPLLIPASFRESGILHGELPRAEGGRLDVAALYDLPFCATRMVRAGMGCAVSLAGLVETPAGSGLATRPIDIEMDMPAYMVWKPLPMRSAACESFLERLQKDARQQFGRHHDEAKDPLRSE